MAWRCLGLRPMVEYMRLLVKSLELAISLVNLFFGAKKVEGRETKYRTRRSFETVGYALFSP